MRLDERRASAPITAAGRNASSTPMTKRAASQSREHVRCQRPDAAEINGEQRQNGAELDQDGKGLAERVVAPAEEVLHQQQVPGGGDRQEFGQALDHTEHRRLDQVDIGREGMHASAPEGNHIER